jgi:DNA-binding transcriptional LysR family regulator
MELRQVRYVEAVARHLNFTRAAEELFVAQPALSLQIQRLEAELGVPLFERTTRQVQLTDAGRTFLDSAQRLLAEVDDLNVRLRDITDASVGRVRMAAQQSVTACGALPALLAEFESARPGVDVVLCEEPASNTASLLRQGRLDLALAQLDDADATPDSERLDAEPLYQEDIVLAVATDHPLLTSARSWPDLAQESFIAFNESAGLRRMLERACADAGFTPRIGYESTALSSIRAIASAGLGVALLPHPALVVPGPPVRVLQIGPALRRSISLVRSADRYHSFAARALTSLLRTRLAELVPLT